MARPREFDEQEVLDKALNVFWTRGFEGTSIQDLVEATGLGRASLYGAFGDKEQLFICTLAHYRARLAAAGEVLTTEPSARRALDEFFESWIGSSCTKQGPKGCFILLSAMTCTSEHPAIRDFLAESALQTEASLEAVVRRGQAQGEFSAGGDAKRLARFIAVSLQGAATAARMGRSRRQLREFIDDVLAHVSGESGAP